MSKLPVQRAPIALISAALLALFIAACQPVVQEAAPAESETADAQQSDSLTIYSGRSENLVDPIIQQFAEQSGVDVEVRYGGTSEMAATILEEGQNSPADVFFGQDAGALGALAKAGRLQELPAALSEQVPQAFRGQNEEWIGISGRARVLVYNTNELTEDDLPLDIWGLTDETWRGRVGWAPTNGSFQAFVTALRVLEGEERAQEWIEAMIANDAQIYPNNSSIVEATAAGEVSVGLVNHYYLYRFLSEQGEDFAARNYHFTANGAGSMINVAGVGLLDTADNNGPALAFIEFLLSNEAQQYFANETYEYPLSGEDITVAEGLTPLQEIATSEIDLTDLDDLQGTLDLLLTTGALDQ